MNREELYDGITGIRDDLILQAEKLRRPAWQQWGAVAAALLVVASLGLGASRLVYRAQHSSGWGGGMNGSSSSDGASPSDNSGGGETTNESYPFMYYAGPVLPLDVLEGGEGLAVSRNLTLDFFGSAERWHYGAKVTDRYVLENTGDEPKAVTLAYPYAGTLNDEPPRMTIDGKEAQTELHAGIYCGGFTGVMQLDGADDTTYNLDSLDTWRDYQALLEDGRYREEAMSAAPELSQPVTVYEFTDFVTPEVEDGAPTLAMEFYLDEEKSQVLTYGMNGSAWDPETGWNSRSVFANPFGRENGPTMVLFLGEDVEEYQVRGYTNGGCEVPLEGVSATVTRYESTLGEVLERLCGEYGREGELQTSMKLYRDSVFRLMERFGPTGETTVDRYRDGRLDDILGETALHERVLYQTAQAMVPAGGSITVEVTVRKGPSYDFACGDMENVGLEGYDLVTTLGSSLDFQEQRVEILGQDGLTLVDQNLGFDPEEDVWEALLDLEEEHYYLEVRQPPEE